MWKHDRIGAKEVCVHSEIITGYKATDCLQQVPRLSVSLCSNQCCFLVIISCLQTQNILLPKQDNRIQLLLSALLIILERGGRVALWTTRHVQQCTPPAPHTADDRDCPQTVAFASSGGHVGAGITVATVLLFRPV